MKKNLLLIGLLLFVNGYVFSQQSPCYYIYNYDFATGKAEWKYYNEKELENDSHPIETSGIQIPSINGAIDFNSTFRIRVYNINALKYTMYIDDKQTSYTYNSPVQNNQSSETKTSQEVSNKVNQTEIESLKNQLSSIEKDLQIKPPSIKALEKDSSKKKREAYKKANPAYYNSLLAFSDFDSIRNEILAKINSKKKDEKKVDNADKNYEIAKSMALVKFNALKGVLQNYFERDIIYNNMKEGVYKIVQTYIPEIVKYRHEEYAKNDSNQEDVDGRWKTYIKSPDTYLFYMLNYIALTIQKSNKDFDEKTIHEVFYQDTANKQIITLANDIAVLCQKSSEHQENALWSTSIPVSDADEIINNIKIRDAKTNNDVVEIPLPKLWVKGALKFNFSSGIGFNFIPTHDFKSIATSNKDTSALIQTDKKKAEYMLTTLMHVYRSTGNTFNFGGALGLGLTNLSRVNFLVGGSLIIGHQERVVISGGLLFSEINSSIFDNSFWGTNVHGSAIYSVNNYKPEDVVKPAWKLNAFVSFTYNLIENKPIFGEKK